MSFKLVSRLRPALVVLFGLLSIAGCNRKEPTLVVAEPEPATIAGPADMFLIAHYRASEVHDNPLFPLLCDSYALYASGGFFGAVPGVVFDAIGWDAIEQRSEKLWGYRYSWVDSVTWCYPDGLPATDTVEREFINIVVCRQPISKKSELYTKTNEDPARPGFRSLGHGELVHFPDEKTIVFVHEKFADRYLGGYAQNREGWPVDAAFLRQAEQHTMLVWSHPAQARASLKKNRDEVERFARMICLMANKLSIPEYILFLEPYPGLFDAQSLTAALDLKGSELTGSLHAKFEDGPAAARGKEAAAAIVRDFKEFLRLVRDSKDGKKPGAIADVVDAFKTNLDQAKIENYGPELNASGVLFKAGPGIQELAAEIQKRMRVLESATQERNEHERQGANLKTLVEAAHKFHDVHGVLPISGIVAGGKPLTDSKGKALLSWRVAILPHLNQRDLYAQFNLNEPWDSEHNKKLIEKMPPIYAPPATVKAPTAQTFYQMVVGPKALWPGLNVPAMADGTSNTLAIVEAAEPVVWTKPDDIFAPGNEMPKDLKKKFGGLYPNGFNAATWDGSTHWIDLRTVTDKDLWSMITPNGGESVDLPR